MAVKIWQVRGAFARGEPHLEGAAHLSTPDIAGQRTLAPRHGQARGARHITRTHIPHFIKSTTLTRRYPIVGQPRPIIQSGGRTINTHRLSIGIISALLAASLVTSARADPSPPGLASPQTALGSAFTYRGQLKSGGTPINATCDIAFRLFDAGSGGFQFGGTLTQTVAITASLFTVDLNFGAGAFAGSARWLDLAVRCPAGAGTYTALTPRQEVTAVPNALYAANAGLLNGQAASAFVDLASAQNIPGVKTFADGVVFGDGSKQTTAYRRPPLPGPGLAATVDNAFSYTGLHTSVTIGADGLPLISYYAYNIANGILRVLHCGNPACNSGNTITAVETANVGQYASITIGGDGLGLISYYEASAGDLKVAHCGSLTCNSIDTLTTVNGTNNVGQYSSITTGVDGYGLISYYDATNASLKVRQCGNAQCNVGGAITVVDGFGDYFAGQYSAITIGADGMGLVSYYDLTNTSLKVLHCGNAACNSGNISATVDNTGNVGQYTSITVGPDGLGLVSYHDAGNGTLKVLHCGNMLCNSGNVSATVDSAASVGTHSSIAIGADGLALVSYYDATNGHLKALRCGNTTCTSGSISNTLDSAFSVGAYTSVAIDPSGLPIISYYDINNQDLKVFRCVDPACAPYVRVGR